jgi:ABC-type nitrate/sulfonate/bicarbonate transport system substrate-binding protein
MDQTVSRRQILKVGVTLAALPVGAAVLQACSSASSTATAALGPTVAPITPGPSITTGAVVAPAIPKTTVRFSMAPYADNTFYIVGIKNGWFKDAGISIAPDPDGKMVLNQDVVPLMLSGGGDISTYFPPNLIGGMSQTTAVKTIAFCDTFVGWAILANPSLKAKTLKDFMTGGMAYADAIKATLAQVKGKNWAVDIDPGERTTFLAIALDQAGMKLQDANVQLLQDTKTVELAMANRIDFASPGGAPQVVQLEVAGWTPILTPLDIINNSPATVDSPGVSLANNTGMVSTADYVNANMDTVVRFVSVMYRIIDAYQSNFLSAAADQLPFLNSVAGTQLDAASLKFIFSTSDPLSNFEYAAKYFVDKTSPLYYGVVYAAQIKQQQAAKVLDPTKTYNPSDVMWGDKIYTALAGYKQQYDQTLAKLTGTLSADRQALVDQAKILYTNRNYLDASRFLAAAAS